MHAHALETLLPSMMKDSNVKILDVGCGSGYLTAVLGRMVEEKPGSLVIGIDYIPELVNMSATNIAKCDQDLVTKGLVEVKQGDGWKGDQGNAPFDVIHVGAAAETMPKALIQQLAPGGRMVIPVGKHDQNFMLVKKDAAGNASQENLMGVRYVPLVKVGRTNEDL